MTVDLTKRKSFGRKLKVILAKHDIRQNNLAETLGITRSYVNQVCSGATIFDAAKNATVYNFFLNLGVSESDLSDYMCLFIEARGNVDLDELDIKLASIRRNPLKSMIVDDIDHLNQANLIKFRRQQEQLLEDQRIEIAAIAGLDNN